jgi:hypothetical protein
MSARRVTRQFDLGDDAVELLPADSVERRIPAALQVPAVL